MQLGGIQTQERYQILLQESLYMTDICLRDLKRDYVKETIALRREISELESCQQKALVILRDCIIRSHEKPLKYHSNIEKEGIQLCLADVEQAMLELGGSRLPSTNLLSERSSLSIHHELFSNPTKKSVCVQTDVTGEKMRMREHTKNRNDMDVDHNDVILIKDRLVEAMYDREVIEGMLSREQEKCCRLEKDKNDLHLELERTAKQRAELNDEVVALRNKIKKLTNALEKTASHKRNTNGNELIKPSMEVDADTFDTLRTNNALREQWVISLLDQEGIDHSGGVFNALCTYIEQLKSRCVTTEADRDLQASEARMLEMCLKTAADALEDALLHDERWRPRTTKSKHTTWHTKKFPGEEWDTVVANMPEGLAMAITHDVAAACHLPEEYVLDIDYRDDETGLYVSLTYDTIPQSPLKK
uniref:Uncharacterized protein TCIL3000_9_4080 n=1 Tax=Trypanosoma congolense (strain IL3000) TaxID=1068625 RepID=G0UUE4_TRYCI|nr:unnamed protein product [Trypanosoma congolense IL3000]